MSDGNPNDTGKAGVPATATGLFTAVGGPQPAQDHAADDFFAQFRTPVTPAPEAPAVAEVAAAPAPAVAESTSDGHLFVRERERSPSAIEREPGAPVVPRMQEVQIKPSAAKLRGVTARSAVDAPPAPAAAPLPTAASAALMQGLGSNVGAFTAAFQTLDGGASRVADTAIPPVPAPVARDEQPIVDLLAATQESGSFTQIFRAGNLPEPPVRQPEATSLDAPEHRAAQAIPKAGPAKATFTELLQAITEGRPTSSDALPTTTPANAGPPAPVKVSSITEILERLDRPQVIRIVPPATPRESEMSTPSAVPTAKAEAPGSFTQFMSSVSAPRASCPAPAPVPVPAPPTQSGSQPSAPVGQPGSFTQLMASIGPAPVSSTPQPEQARSQPVTPPSGARPGSMTELLQSLDPPKSGAASASAPPAVPSSGAAPASSPGGFTQFFQSPLAQKTPEPVRTPFDQPQATAAGASGTGQAGAFTQLMQSLGPAPGSPGPAAAPAAPPAGGASDGWMAKPAAHVPEAPHLASGNVDPLGQAGSFTRLMKTLDGPGTLPPQAPAPQPMPQRAGVDGSATSIFSAPSMRPATAPAAASGPGEFTRILSASDLRDALAKGPAAPTGPAPAPMVPGAMQMPPMVMPVMPQASQMAPMAMPGFAMPQMQAPQAPAAPVAPQPVAKTKLQQYLPLILIANALVIVVIIVIVIFVVRAHK